MSKAVARTLFVLVFSAIGITVSSSDLILPWHPYGFYGITTSENGTIVGVAPWAVREGLHLGDRLDFARMTMKQRFSYGRPVVPNSTMTIPLTAGRTISAIAPILARTTLDNVSDIIAILCCIAYILIASALVLLRPCAATWAFYAFSYGFCIFAATPNTWAFPVALAGGMLLAIALSLAPAAFVSFSIRFPDARPRGGAAVFERAIVFVVTPLLTLWNLYNAYGIVFGAPPAARLWTALAALGSDAIFATGIVILVTRYITAEGSDRNRLQWVVAAFAVAFLPFLALGVIVPAGTFVTVSPTAINFSQAWTILAPIALAYTVLRHRLFDIRFVLSRALVYALLTSFTVGVLALVDWALSRWLEESRFALIVELGLAVALGVALTSAHRRVESFLNNVIFRAQTLALQALRRFAQETDLIADPDRLLSQTYAALCARIECDYAGIYTVDGTSFVLATPNGGATPPLLAADDFAVLRLRRWSEPFECDEPGHQLRGALLVPMSARTQLVGFIACGPKRDRTHYLPEEIETLSTLAHRAGSSYGWLTMTPVATPLPTAVDV